MNRPNRNHAPVFVVGSPRSGTTLLYDMLLSSGGFAVYLTESNVFSLLAQRFGPLDSAHNRRRLLDVWLNSKLRRATAVSPADFEARILSGCRNYGDFLRLTMEEIARQQGMVRWAENTPEHILYIPIIKAAIPDALFVHMIRDGRAVALSLDRRKDRGLQVLPWDRPRNLLIQGIYWEWIVRRGRQASCSLGADYIELRFEDLIQQPQPTLSRLGEFLEHELDYARIQQVGYGSVTKPNTSFRAEPAAQAFDPVSRWRKAYSPEQLADFEALTGSLLQELNYPLLTAGSASPSAFLLRTRAVYRAYYGARFRAKTLPLTRMLRPRLGARELDEIVMGDDHPPTLVEDPTSTRRP